MTATACATCGAPIQLAQFMGEARHERAIALQATPVVALVGPALGDDWEVRQSHPIHAPYCGAIMPPPASNRRKRRNGTGDTAWDPMDKLVRAIGDAI